MQNNEKQIKRKRKFWYGWLKAACNQFNLSDNAIKNRYIKNDPELIEWLKAEIERRENTKETKKTLEERYKNLLN